RAPRFPPVDRAAAGASLRGMVERADRRPTECGGVSLSVRRAWVPPEERATLDQSLSGRRFLVAASGLEAAVTASGMVGVGVGRRVKGEPHDHPRLDESRLDRLSSRPASSPSAVRVLGGCGRIGTPEGTRPTPTALVRSTAAGLADDSTSEAAQAN